MKKLLLFLPLFLFASFYPDFRPCMVKYSYIKDSIPVSKNLSITFDASNCVKYDPFTGMCIIKHKNKKFITFGKKAELGWWIASIRYNEIYVGNFAKDEVFFVPAKMSVNTVKNSVVTDMFCRAVGIGGDNGFIKGETVKHFLKYGYWGDIGIEVDENMNILSFDPFYVKGIKTGEKIIAINSNPANPQTFKKYIIMQTVGKTVLVRVGKKTLKLKIRKKRYLYTPLEHFGIKVNKNLEVVSMPQKWEKVYLIKPGAKIVKVNGKKIETFEELKKALSTYKNVTISLSQQGIKATIPLR